MKKVLVCIGIALYDKIMEVWSNEATEYAGHKGPYKTYDDGRPYNVLKKYSREDIKVER